MRDVHRVEGPQGNPNPPERKSVTDPTKFQEAMKQKVGELDPEQEKKKKQQEEETEEAPPTTQEATPSTPTNEGDSSFLSVQKGTQQSFRSSSLQEQSYTPPPITSSSSFDEDTLNDSISTESATTTSSSYTPSSPSSETTGSQQTTPPAHETHSSQEKKHKQEPSFLPPPVAPHKETPLMPPPLVPELQTKIETFQDEVQGIGEQQGVAPGNQVAPLQGILDSPLKPAPDKKTQAAAASLVEEGGVLAPKEGIMMISPPKEVSPADPFARLPLAIQELFTRMLGVILVMQQTPGVKETTFILNNPKFASSVFFGSQIIIKEFSTAPLVFNIQLNGSQQATALFQKNLDDLAAAFQAGQHTFKINRLETGYLSERPLFHRKESLHDEGMQQDTGEHG